MYCQSGLAPAFLPHLAAHVAAPVQSPLAWRPGAVEAALGPKPDSKNQRLARDRHTLLPWGALQEMLQRIAAAGRDREAYVRQAEAEQHYVEMLQGTVLRPKRRPQGAGVDVSAAGNEVAAAAAADAAAAAAAAAAPGPAGAGGAGRVGGAAGTAAAAVAAAAAAGAASRLEAGLQAGMHQQQAGHHWESASELSVVAALCCLLMYAWLRGGTLLRPSVARLLAAKGARPSSSPPAHEPGSGLHCS